MYTRELEKPLVEHIWSYAYIRHNTPFHPEQTLEHVACMSAPPMVTSPAVFGQSLQLQIDHLTFAAPPHL